MKTLISTLVAVSLTLLLAQCSSTKKTNLAESLPACPLPNSGETQKDCPWARIGRAPQFAEALQELAPGLATQIQRDAVAPLWLGLWGQSLNWDEGAKQPIVSPATLDSLFALGQVPPRRDQIVHAGMMHIYGYLFSTLRTPFGYKRSRWVDGEIEAGIGLRARIFSPTPPSGTQFANITYALSKIALVGEPGVDQILFKRLADIDSSLMEYRFQDLEVVRLMEAADGIVLRTDIVKFPKAETLGQKNNHLLIYSVKTSHSAAAQLITAFPVNQYFVDSTLSEKNQGLSVPIVSRYNAYVPGITQAQPPKIGIRKVVDRPT